MMTDDQLTSVASTEPKEDVLTNEVPDTTTVAEEPSISAEQAAPDQAPEVVAEAPVAEVHEPAPVELPAPVRAPEPVVQVDDSHLFDDAMAMMGTEESGSESGFKKLNKGDRVEATVIQIDNDKVFVNLGTKSEGIVPLGELGENVEVASDHVKVGDVIQVIVLRPEGSDGNAVVSKKKADFEDTWATIEKAFEEGRMINATVIDRVKGGLVVDLGVRGFVPATHVGSGKLRNIEKYVGETLELKIIELDRDRKKVVLSNREAESQARAKAKDELFTTVAPGDVVEGTVRRIADYGAFVDLGGVDGLLHISEMSWMRISNPRELFKEGQKIKVMVLRLDAAAGKISLGHRQVLPDPWTLIRANYVSGQKLTTVISRVVMSGAFVKLPEGAEAFIPVSEMSTRRIKSPSEVVEEGQTVEVLILDLRPDERRMVLSMRAAGSGDSIRPTSDSETDEDGKKGKKGKKGRGRGREEDDFDDFGGGRRGYATGGATIGERLGLLKGILGRDDEDDLETPAVEVEAEAVVADAPVVPEAVEPAEVVDAAIAPSDEPVAEPSGE